MNTNSDRVFVTHLLKRTSFSVTPGKIDQLVKLDQAKLLSQLVDKAKNPVISVAPDLINRESESYPDFLAILKTELKRLSLPQSGLGDRMLWFWHGLITSSYEKVNYPGLLWRQHKLIAKHALGSFRQLLIDISKDPAMLIYLDGDYSVGSDPNENYARELMELFTMGRGNYSQEDVSAAAKVLSGWYVQGLPEKDNQHYTLAKVRAKYHAEDGFSEPVTFLGQTGSLSIEGLIDRILQQDSTALFIVEHLFRHFVHAGPSEAVLQELAELFRRSNYQIRPVVARMFRHPEFTSALALSGRAKLPLEWLLSAVKATGLSSKQIDYESYLDAAGQMPFAPANVAGWATGNRWLSAAAAMARNAIAIKALELPARQTIIKNIARAADPIAVTINQLSLLDVSKQTRNQLQVAVNQVPDRIDQARLLLTLVLASPEFALS